MKDYDEKKKTDLGEEHWHNPVVSVVSLLSRQFLRLFEIHPKPRKKETDCAVVVVNGGERKKTKRKPVVGLVGVVSHILFVWFSSRR
jgi:hypothetical protein